MRTGLVLVLLLVVGCTSAPAATPAPAPPTEAARAAPSPSPLAALLSPTPAAARPTCNLTSASATPLAFAATPGALPAPSVDRIGFPDNYQARFTLFYVEDQFANRQIRTVYANDKAASVKAG